MKIIFFGSDEFSIKSIEACLHSQMEIVLVVTTPAQKKGRGLKLEPSEVFKYCRAKKLPVQEFQKLRDPEVVKTILALRPDLFVAASYGKLIPPELLAIPKYRLNVHPSLLPKYRGAAPIHWPILNGDAETGVSVIDIAEKMDAGDIYLQETLTLGSRMTAQDLASQLSSLSYGVLKKVLEQVKNGNLRGVPQDEAAVTVAPQLEKKDGEISFKMRAEDIDRRVRGLQPWPGCYFFYKGSRIGLLETDLPKIGIPEPLPPIETDLPPALSEKNVLQPCTAADIILGAILSIEKDGSMAVATGEGVILIRQVKPEGKKAMAAADFAHGRRLEPGKVLE